MDSLSIFTNTIQHQYTGAQRQDVTNKKLFIQTRKLFIRVHVFIIPVHVFIIPANKSITACGKTRPKPTQLSLVYVYTVHTLYIVNTKTGGQCFHTESLLMNVFVTLNNKCH